jgi:cell division protein FtsB
MKSSALLPFALMVMAVTTVPILVLDEEGLPRYRSLKRELADLRLSNQELVQEIAEMKREIGALRSDPSSVERIARDELGMVRPDEYVFQFDGE